jgi:hypothetical protein
VGADGLPWAQGEEHPERDDQSAFVAPTLVMTQSLSLLKSLLGVMAITASAVGSAMMKMQMLWIT